MYAGRSTSSRVCKKYIHVRVHVHKENYDFSKQHCYPFLLYEQCSDMTSNEEPSRT